MTPTVKLVTSYEPDTESDVLARCLGSDAGDSLTALSSVGQIEILTFDDFLWSPTAHSDAIGSLDVVSSADHFDTHEHPPSSDDFDAAVDVLDNTNESDTVQIGGSCGDGSGGVRSRDMPHFNSRELRQRLDFKEIGLDNLQQVPGRVRESLANLIDQALEDAPSGSMLNVVLRGPSLTSDVQCVLQSDDDYNTDLFLEEIMQVLQSNDESISSET